MVLHCGNVLWKEWRHEDNDELALAKVLTVIHSSIDQDGHCSVSSDASTTTVHHWVLS